MIVKEVLDRLCFNGHVVLIFYGRIQIGESSGKVYKKYGFYEISYFCIQDNVLIICCK